jgi:hypothetical protein
MRIWLIGAEDPAIRAIVQLRKNPNIQLVVSSPVEDPKAVRDGVLERVDYVERVNHINVNDLGRRIRPDLILIDASAAARDYARFAGGTALSDELTRAVASAAQCPCLVLG